MHQKAEPINVANFKRKQFRIAKYPSVVNINILAGFCNCITDNLLVTHSFKVACPQYSRLMKPFFFEIPNFWVDKFWGIKGIFSRTISTHFGTVMFSIFQLLFRQKIKPLYPHPKYLFGIWV